MNNKCTKCGADVGYFCVTKGPCDFCAQPKPEVGMGVTYGCWTDRYAATIIKVSPSGKTITVRDDIAIRTDKNGLSESQTYRYEPGTGGTKTFRITTRHGRKNWRSGVYRATVGIRNAYRDPSF